MHDSAALREKLFTMRMSEEERARSEALASHFGLNVAGLIRMLLKEKARELALEPSAAAPAAPTARTRSARKSR